MSPNLDGYHCEECGFELWLPLASLSVSALGLYDDARFPGRCILAYRKRHLDDLTELGDDEIKEFFVDIKRASRVIQRLTEADRVNYAILGNAEPHLHVHLIPRRFANDPIPNKAPWAHPDAHSKLPELIRDGLVEALRGALR